MNLYFKITLFIGHLTLVPSSGIFVHFCHEGVQRVQNASREYTKHVRVNDIGFQKFDSKEDFLQKSMPKAVTAEMITKSKKKVRKNVQKCPRRAQGLRRKEGTRVRERRR